MTKKQFLAAFAAKVNFIGAMVITGVCVNHGLSVGDTVSAIFLWCLVVIMIDRGPSR